MYRLRSSSDSRGVCWFLMGLLCFLLLFSNQPGRLVANLSNIELGQRAASAFEQPSLRSVFSQWLVTALVEPTSVQARLLHSGNSHALLNVLGGHLEDVDDIRSVARGIGWSTAGSWLIRSAALQCQNGRCAQAETFLQVFDETYVASDFSPQDVDLLAETNALLATDYALTRKMPEQGLAYAERAIQLAPNNCQVLISSGYVVRRSGRMAVAADPIRRATELCPDWGQAWFAWGVQLRSMGRPFFRLHIYQFSYISIFFSG